MCAVWWVFKKRKDTIASFDGLSPIVRNAHSAGLNYFLANPEIGVLLGEGGGVWGNMCNLVIACMCEVGGLVLWGGSSADFQLAGLLQIC